MFESNKNDFIKIQKKEKNSISIFTFASINIKYQYVSSHVHYFLGSKIFVFKSRSSRFEKKEITLKVEFNLENDFLDSKVSNLVRCNYETIVSKCN